MIKREFAISGSEIKQKDHDAIVKSVTHTITRTEWFKELCIERFSIPNGEDDFDVNETRAWDYAFELASGTVDATTVWFTVEIRE